MRVIRRWSDDWAAHVYLLQKLIPASKIIFFNIKEKWVTVAIPTNSLYKAECWAQHYGVEIQDSNE